MNTEQDSDMVLREPVVGYMVGHKPATVAASHARPGAQTKLGSNKSVVEDMDEFTAGLMRAFGEAKDKAVRENNQLKVDR